MWFTSKLERINVAGAAIESVTSREKPGGMMAVGGPSETGKVSRGAEMLIAAFVDRGGSEEEVIDVG
jgi:hypothetical protein